MIRFVVLVATLVAGAIGTYAFKQHLADPSPFADGDSEPLRRRHPPRPRRGSRSSVDLSPDNHDAPV